MNLPAPGSADQHALPVVRRRFRDIGGIAVYTSPTGGWRGSLSVMDQTRFDRLTDGQRECLRLFHARFEIKDIARQIGRSPVTVNQRLAAARRHIGVDRSSEAARLLVEHEAELCIPPIYSPSALVDLISDDPHLVPETQQRHSFPLPFPTWEHPVNDMSFGAKLLYAVILAALIALIFGGTTAALGGLSELF